MLSGLPPKVDSDTSITDVVATLVVGASAQIQSQKGDPFAASARKPDNSGAICGLVHPQKLPAKIHQFWIETIRRLCGLVED